MPLESVGADPLYSRRLALKSGDERVFELVLRIDWLLGLDRRRLYRRRGRLAGCGRRCRRCRASWSRRRGRFGRYRRPDRGGRRSLRLRRRLAPHRRRCFRRWASWSGRHHRFGRRRGRDRGGGRRKRGGSGRRSRLHGNGWPCHDRRRRS